MNTILRDGNGNYLMHQLIQAASLDGKVFRYQPINTSTGLSRLTLEAVYSHGISIFNPADSGKTLYVQSIEVLAGSGVYAILYHTTSDPVYLSGTLNAKSPTGAVSAMSCTFYRANSFLPATPGVLVDSCYANGGITSQNLLLKNELVSLPPGNGIAIIITLSGETVVNTNLCVKASGIEL